MFGVQLADVSTRYSSHPQGISEARCENAGALSAWMLRLHARAARRRGRSASASVISAGVIGPSPQFLHGNDPAAR